MAYVFMAVLFLTAVFLILLVLVQRGKGGGLAGAFGGMGGQSAFGTKAGDLFTRITIGVAAFWIILCMVMVKYFGTGQDILDPDLGKPKQGAPATPNTEGPSGGGAQPQSTPSDSD